jgi:signal transduction histidine kinase
MIEIRPLHIRIPIQLGLLIAGFIVLVTMSLTSLWLARESDKASEEVAHTLEVNTTIVLYQGALRRAESGQRGYLLTGDPAYLADYEIGARRLWEIYPDLERLIADNPEQQQKLAGLQPLVQAKMQELDETIAMARSGRRDEAITLTRSNRGLDTMNAALAQILAMLNDERRLLAERRDYSDRTNLLLFIVNFVGGLVITILALSSISLIRKRSDQLASAHAQLAAANAELAQNNVMLEERVAERTADLREANDEIQRFAFIVSHDLRSPLVNIMGFTSELAALQDEIFAEPKPGDAPAKREQQREEFTEALGFIKASIAKMDRLINAILQLSRAGRREFTPREIDLAVLVKTLAGDVAHRAGEVNAKIEIGALPTITSDRLALEQIFSNLLDNAIKYLRRDLPGQIDVTATERGNFVVIEVSDNGRGIDPRDHERIFELFRRAGKQDVAGEGIGLAHVRALVRRLGGSIKVESALNQGTTFTIILPKHWTA